MKKVRKVIPLTLPYHDFMITEDKSTQTEEEQKQQNKSTQTEEELGKETHSTETNNIKEESFEPVASTSTGGFTVRSMMKKQYATKSTAKKNLNKIKKEPVMERTFATKSTAKKQKLNPVVSLTRLEVFEPSDTDDDSDISYIYVKDSDDSFDSDTTVDFDFND